MKTVGIIGGSGLYEIEGLEDVEHVEVDTPWGEPSDSLVSCVLDDVRMVFLPRHGRGHRLLPSEINYRANIHAMKALGVEWIISVSAVGSMKDKIAPGHVVIPNQFIDNTKRRESTFFGEGLVAHVSMADPVCTNLSRILFESSLDEGATVHMGGTYVCIEGPQFSSRAESELYRNWGVDVIGMTNMPEAKLAREAEMCYSTLALSTDYDCWHESHEYVSVGDVVKILTQNVNLAKKIIARAVKMIKTERDCYCINALENAILTSQDVVPVNTKQKLEIFIKEYIK